MNMMNSMTNMKQKEKFMEQTKVKKKEQNIEECRVERDFQFQEQIHEIDEILQRPRTQEYIISMEMIDYLSSDDEEIIERIKENTDEKLVEELQQMPKEDLLEIVTQSVQEEFKETEENQKEELLVILARCYIKDHDCHAISRRGKIMQHYRKDAFLYEDMQRGRTVLREYMEECQCVEVYNTCCRVISKNGKVMKVIKK